MVATEEFVTPLEALGRVELYLLWITRLAVVLVTQVTHTHILLHCSIFPAQVIAALYKAFGQTFIRDDLFLGVLGSITSVFNCTGRLFYGTIMDKASYKEAIELKHKTPRLTGRWLPNTRMI